MTERVPSLRHLAGEATKQTTWGRKVIRAKDTIRLYERYRDRGMARNDQFHNPERYQQKKQQYQEAKQALNTVARQQFGAPSYAQLRQQMELPPELDWL